MVLKDYNLFKERPKRVLNVKVNGSIERFGRF